MAKVILLGILSLVFRTVFSQEDDDPGFWNLVDTANLRCTTPDTVISLSPPIQFRQAPYPDPSKPYPQFPSNLLFDNFPEGFTIRPGKSLSLPWDQLSTSKLLGFVDWQDTSDAKGNYTLSLFLLEGNRVTIVRGKRSSSSLPMTITSDWMDFADASSCYSVSIAAVNSQEGRPLGYFYCMKKSILYRKDFVTGTTEPSILNSDTVQENLMLPAHFANVYYNDGKSSFAYSYLALNITGGDVYLWTHNADNVKAVFVYFSKDTKKNEEHVTNFNVTLKEMKLTGLANMHNFSVANDPLWGDVYVVLVAGTHHETSTQNKFISYACLVNTTSFRVLACRQFFESESYVRYHSFQIASSPSVYEPSPEDLYGSFVITVITEENHSSSKNFTLRNFTLPYNISAEVRENIMEGDITLDAIQNYDFTNAVSKGSPITVRSSNQGLIRVEPSRVNNPTQFARFYKLFGRSFNIHGTNDFSLFRSAQNGLLYVDHSKNNFGVFSRYPMVTFDCSVMKGKSSDTLRARYAQNYSPNNIHVFEFNIEVVPQDKLIIEDATPTISAGIKGYAQRFLDPRVTIYGALAKIDTQMFSKSGLELITEYGFNYFLADITKGLEFTSLSAIPAEEIVPLKEYAFNFKKKLLYKCFTSKVEASNAVCTKIQACTIWKDLQASIKGELTEVKRAFFSEDTFIGLFTRKDRSSVIIAIKLLQGIVRQHVIEESRASFTNKGVGAVITSFGFYWFLSEKPSGSQTCTLWAIYSNWQPDNSTYFIASQDYIESQFLTYKLEDVENDYFAKNVDNRVTILTTSSTQKGYIKLTTLYTAKVEREYFDMTLVDSITDVKIDSACFTGTGYLVSGNGEIWGTSRVGTTQRVYITPIPSFTFRLACLQKSNSSMVTFSDRYGNNRFFTIEEEKNGAFISSQVEYFHSQKDISQELFVSHNEDFAFSIKEGNPLKLVQFPIGFSDLFCLEECATVDTKSISFTWTLPYTPSESVSKPVAINLQDRRPDSQLNLKVTTPAVDVKSIGSHNISSAFGGHVWSLQLSDNTGMNKTIVNQRFRRIDLDYLPNDAGSEFKLFASNSVFEAVVINSTMKLSKAGNYAPLKSVDTMLFNPFDMIEYIRIPPRPWSSNSRQKLASDDEMNSLAGNEDDSEPVYVMLAKAGLGNHETFLDYFISPFNKTQNFSISVLEPNLKLYPLVKSRSQRVKTAPNGYTLTVAYLHAANQSLFVYHPKCECEPFELGISRSVSVIKANVEGIEQIVVRADYESGTLTFTKFDVTPVKCRMIPFEVELKSKAIWGLRDIECSWESTTPPNFSCLFAGNPVHKIIHYSISEDRTKIKEVRQEDYFAYKNMEIEQAIYKPKYANSPTQDTDGFFIVKGIRIIGTEEDKSNAANYDAQGILFYRMFSEGGDGYASGGINAFEMVNFGFSEHTKLFLNDKNELYANTAPKPTKFAIQKFGVVSDKFDVIKSLKVIGEKIAEYPVAFPTKSSKDEKKVNKESQTIWAILAIIVILFCLVIFVFVSIKATRIKPKAQGQLSIEDTLGATIANNNPTDNDL